MRKNLIFPVIICFLLISLSLSRSEQVQTKKTQLEAQPVTLQINRTVDKLEMEISKMKNDIISLKRDLNAAKKQLSKQKEELDLLNSVFTFEKDHLTIDKNKRFKIHIHGDELSLGTGAMNLQFYGKGYFWRGLAHKPHGNWIDIK